MCRLGRSRKKKYEGRGYKWCGTSVSVNATMLSETLYVVGFAEATGRPFWLQKKPMNLCVCDSKEREHGVSAGVNDVRNRT